MSPAIIEILVLAGIAIFLVLRLKNVLGTREGFEKPPLQESSPSKKNRDFRVIDGGEDTDITDNIDKKSPSADALARMKKVDNGFLVNEFLSGARSAYEMILMAFAAGDLSSVRGFLGDDVYAGFAGAIDAREAAGETLSTQITRLDKPVLEDARIDNGVVQLDVRYRAEFSAAFHLFDETAR